MPELPEVQCVVNTLKRITNKKIAEVTTFTKKLREPIQINLNDLLKDKEIKSIRRRGKFIIFDLNTGEIVSHLGMTGKFLIQEKLIDNKFNQVAIKFTDNSYLVYNDIRKFGFITYEEEPNTNKYIKKLGVEPLTIDFNGNILYEMLSKSKANIKQFLLDQSIVVGLGNIYVIELLYICKINPETKANTITKEKASELVIEIKKILETAIKAGGSSISDYRDADDKSGSFQNSHKIYGKKNDPLGHDIEIIKQNGRSTYYCPICQTC